MQASYEEIIEREQAALAGHRKRFAAVGYLKLLLLVLFVVVVFWLFRRPQLVLYRIEAVILLAVQVVAWTYHAHLHRVMDHKASLVAIHQRHLDRIQSRWTAFDDTGEEFADAAHPYGNDLDIIGEKSLFQLLNVTHTWHGRQAFARDLLNACYTEPEIIQRQEAVEELAGDIDYAGELESRFARIGYSPAAPGLLKDLQDYRPFLRSRVLRALLHYGPLAVLLFVGLVVIFRWERFYLLSVCLYAVQALSWAGSLLFTSRYLNGISRLPFKLGAYQEVLTFLSASPFRAARLRQIKMRLTQSEQSAARAIKELAGIADKVSVRANPIVYFVLNVLFLWDLDCAFLFADWKKKYSGHCEAWFLALGEVESLSCLAVLRNVCSHTCFPKMSGESGVVGVELGHPLIPNEERVCNSLQLQHNILIISGSNMSGKTTFLRTVGLNVVLARAGGPVCAGAMSLADLHVVTSMRIADDLSEGVSTFYAELKRIKAILDAAKGDGNTLFLIDEIFRGTNSVDRLSGARTVIEKLGQLGVCGMITTHDLELCELERSAPNIRNYSFAERYENGRILFDYKMRQGKSTTTNAKYLMELLGIV